MESGDGDSAESDTGNWDVAEPRILLITGLWPTEDRPSAGIFVKRRVGDLPITVVAPSSYEGRVVLRYARLAWSALTVRGNFRGVEAHPLFPTGLIGLAVARLRGIPLVTYAHGADVRETAIENRLTRALARLVVRGAAAIIANSGDTAALVERLGGTAKVIPPGVDLSRFRPTPRPDDRRILYLGGSEKRKGIHVAKQLADTLVGPGLETVSPDEVAGLMAAHDIVLIPSLAEPYGLVAAEAIASGRWVVARAVGGLLDIVEDGVTGTLVHGDAEFPTAIASVPDYDPDTVAAHASRFAIGRANEASSAVWRTLIERSGRTPP
jgi:glycosyltransferase involved in cell wall biosynthesis